MKEKILALLTTKFAGVRKDGLARLAQTLSLQVENETEAGALVEKLTAEKVNEFVSDYRKDVDKEVSDANKTYETTLKKKYDFVEKKAEPTKEPEPTKPDDAPAWAKALIDQNKALTDRLSAIETGKTVETRLQQLQSKFKDKNLPESFTSQKVKDFKRMSFESDDAFAEYLTELDADVTAFNQELADKGLSGQGKPMFGNKDNNGISSGVASFIESKSKEKSPLAGKEV